MNTSDIAVIVWDVVASAVMFVAVVRVACTPAERWPHGRLSKVSWVVGVIWFAPVLHSAVWPVGAAAAIWHTRRLQRSVPAGPDPLPFARGEADVDSGDAATAVARRDERP